MIYYLSEKQWPIGQAVKTLASHAGNSGSIPGWVTKKDNVRTFGSDVIFLSKPRLGMASMRLRIVWNRRRRMASPKVHFPCGLIPYATTSQFHTATGCGFYTRLWRDLGTMARGIRSLREIPEYSNFKSFCKKPLLPSCFG